jgi:dipeptidyl aminopeptidase/acylaminoacyl peptidase
VRIGLIAPRSLNLLIPLRGLLAGKWGVRDVQDCLHAAKSLARDIDVTRTVIRGGSSGGYTVLSSLSFGPENTFYAAATSLYGISNLRLLTQFTHKFELRYMEKLMGGTIEEIPDVYDKERSPLFHADKVKTPLLVSQQQRRRSHINLHIIRSYKVQMTRLSPLSNRKPW